MTLVQSYGAAASENTQDYWENLLAESRLYAARERYGDRLVASTHFGPNSVITLHWLNRLFPDVPIIFVDTQHAHRLNEFYRDLVERAIPNLNLHVYRAEDSASEQLEKYGARWEQGEEGIKAHFQHNKIEPFERAINVLGRDVWITGRRRVQNEARKHMPVFEQQPDGATKINFIADFTHQDVENYIAAWGLPEHRAFPGRVGEFFEKVGHAGECGVHQAQLKFEHGAGI